MTVTMDRARRLSANFTLNVYTVRVETAHGTAAPAVGEHIYSHGTAVTNTVTETETVGGTQYVCTGWVMTGNAPFTGSATSCVMTVTNHAVLTWTWKTQHLWTVTVSPGGAGTVAPASGGWYDAGAGFTATAMANTGWVFTNWTGSLTGTSTNLAVTMNAAHAVTANFASTGGVPPTASLTVFRFR
jgi:hypothetical protein